MKYDDVLTLLGEFGRYQKIVYFLIVLPIVFVGIQEMAPVFILATPRHRCALPFLDNDTFAIQSQRHQDLVDLYIPWDNTNDDYSKCLIYKKEYPASFSYPKNNTDFKNEQTVNYTNGSETESCSRWVYDDTIFANTAITETNLVCSTAIYKAHATTALNIGAILSFISCGPIADRVGRKFVSMIDFFVMIVSAILLTWMPNIYVFIAIRALIGFGFGAFFNIIFVYALEFIGPSKRTLYGIIVDHFWAFGLLFQAVAAYFIRSWRTLHLVTSLPLVIFLCYWWKLPKSGRWLLANGYIEEGKEVLRAMSKINKVNINTDDLEIDDLQEPETQEDKRRDCGCLALHLFKNKALAFISIIVFINWLVVSMMYYGLSLNVGNLSGNIYTNFTVSTAMEVVGYSICIPGMHWLGRKKFHCLCMLTGGVALLFVLVPELIGNNDTKWLIIVFAQIGKLASSMAYAVIYLLSAELYPTVLRGTALGWCSVFGFIGAILAPYIVEMANLLDGHFVKIVPLIIFGTTSLVAGLLSLYLPETYNVQLPDSISDMESNRRTETSVV